MRVINVTLIITFIRRAFEGHEGSDSICIAFDINNYFLADFNHKLNFENETEKKNNNKRNRDRQSSESIKHLLVGSISLVHIYIRTCACL